MLLSQGSWSDEGERKGKKKGGKGKVTRDASIKLPDLTQGLSFSESLIAFGVTNEFPCGVALRGHVTAHGPAPHREMLCLSFKVTLVKWAMS